jgi:hypothetical protein
MNKNDVVSIVTLTGEFVGKYMDENTDQYIIADPRLLTQTQEGVAFIPAVCMTGIQQPDEVKFNKSAVAFVIKTAFEVEKEYRRVTSGLIV